MKIIVTKNYHEMSKEAAQIIAQVIANNPRCVLGLATGSSPIETYDILADMCQKGQITFANVKAVNLDEYVGLPSDHNQSYAYFMRQNFFDKIDIDLANTHIPNGTARNLQEECTRYSSVLAALSRDVQVLGIGSNGHIGFNEPNTPFDTITHVVTLAQSTVQDNSRLFDSVNEVPRQALTMGIAEIMQAKKIVVLASGKNKAQAVATLVNGAVDTTCPASILQTHPDCILIIDQDANSILNYKE